MKCGVAGFFYLICSQSTARKNAWSLISETPAGNRSDDSWQNLQYVNETHDNFTDSGLWIIYNTHQYTSCCLVMFTNELFDQISCRSRDGHLRREDERFTPVHHFAVSFLRTLRAKRWVAFNWLKNKQKSVTRIHDKVSNDWQVSITKFMLKEV